MQDETSAWLYLKKRRCSLRPTGMLLWLHGMTCSTRLQSLKESTGSKNWLMRCPCFKMSRLGLIKMETPFWRHFNTGSFFGICWEFWHGYTLLKSWEELRVRTELKTQDVRDTRSNLYYHDLAGFLIIIWINKLLFYNHRTQINRFVSQWIMKFPRFLINWWWLWPSFHLHAPNQFLTSNWKLVVEDPRLMVTYCFMFCKFLQYVYAVCFWFPCIQITMILEAEGSSSRHGFWGKIATKPTFFEMDIRIFIHHEIWKCQAAIPILVSLDLCTQIFCKKNCLGWNTLTIFCYELVTRTLPISKDLSSLYNTCKSLLLSPMCTNLDLLLRLQQ